jgi:D-amino-acid dehydrogenase
MSGQSIAVVGAGIVGACTAAWLHREGHEVVLIDRDEPGAGTSYGNACTIADYGCIPINSPALLKKLPWLLWSGESPLSLDPGFLLRHPGWTLSFLRNCMPDRVEHIIHSLAAILSHTRNGLDPLVGDAGAEHLFNHQGCLYAYQTRASYEAALPSNQKRADAGFTFETLDGRQLEDLEPGLKQEFHRALWFRKASQVVNPRSLVERLVEHFSATGGEFRRAEVIAVEADGSVILKGGDRLPTGRAVITAGAFSKRIHCPGMQSLPLDTERGYHVQYAGRQSLLTRPVAWAEGGFYATPTNEGLRFAGTVEIASLDKAPSQARLNYLTRYARQMFELEGEPSQTWLGFRPTFPDSLPVIGPSPASDRILFAFGHHHIGLTLAGITGKLVAQLAGGEPPDVDPSPYDPSRFS